MSEVRLIIRNQDKTRKKELTVERNYTASAITNAAKEQFNIPRETSCALVNVDTRQTIPPTQQLTESVVSDGNILEIQPILESGGDTSV